MTIRVMVADDEPLARERIKHLLLADSDFQVVHECRNGAEVVKTLESADVDLLLLDIRMPGLNGLDVADRVARQHRMPMIVFVTAHDSYAIRAFDVNAVDYLLKPLEPKRFHESMTRVKERLSVSTAALTHEKLASVLTTLTSLKSECAYVTRVVVRSGAKDLFVNIQQISWIEAADYYVCLHVGDQKHLLRESIKHLETQLDPKQFIRVHRSAIVNIEFVQEIRREGRSEGWIQLSNGERVRLSAAGWQKLLAASTSR